MIRFLFLSALGFLLFVSGCREKPTPGKNIVILVGPKSHPAGMHEYLKSARLIKVMLERAANIKNVKADLCFNGWPEEEKILEEADLILTISDGRDGQNGLDVPFFTDQRMEKIKKQMDRGCGFMTFHYSTFAPDKYGEQILEWGGGYFDWQNEAGERDWYSAIQFLEVTTEMPHSDHPVHNGVRPFRILEEYYYQIRFRENDNRLIPLINIKELENPQAYSGVAAWAVERENGGRGFGTTLGHFYANWKDPDYRKFLLNAILWTAGGEVPEAGVESPFYTDREVSRVLNGKEHKALILTGRHHPSHPWEKTTPAIKAAIESEGGISADVSTDIHDLSQYDLRDYDLLVFNYCNWEEPDPIWDADKKSLIDFIHNGGGLIFLHFANGAFHFSLPGAGESDWPEYRQFCRRVWNHNGKSSHDDYGPFVVSITDSIHAITEGLIPFTITDELYVHQEGDLPVHVLLSAVSKNTGKPEPLAWIYELEGGNGKTARVFQTVLGHDSVSLTDPSLQKILNRASCWVVNGSRLWNDL